MRYRQLGRYGIRVSEVSLGGWLTQGRTIDDATTENIVRKAFDLGINLFDTADVYNRGEAELSLGKATAGLKREELVIATKCYFPMSDRPNDRGLGRKHITESVHASLKRLRTDYIDLMQFHRFDADTPMDETVRAIDDLVRQGKVLYWGVSEWQAHQITELVHTARSLNANPPASNQPQYHMLNPGIEKSVLPTCQQFGLGNIVFSPLAQGVLTGKYLPGQPAPEGSRGADETSNNFMQGMLNDETLTRVQRLKDYANEMGHPLARFALAWCLRQPGVSSVIVGASRPEQIEANAEASGVELPAEVWQRAAEILEGKE
ncbi:aldo/keto reductase family protein [Fimbriimonas ginsengisoli]|uniref:aldo/keto reductase family protein n=1 Tax=Fimbriimonas ginsengisoli TaxID=1005039 RepID=UPI00046C9D32|nr:aldo/keto reductase family protein [Fimbriimonas ginsengisoli]